MLDGFAVRPIDTVSAATLGHDVLVMAQPRLLSPDELVALDAWVRGGGRVLIFADPNLAWPSLYPLGDRRRAPPITLLDPLLRHWGLTLEAGDTVPARHDLDGFGVATVAAGHWRTPQDCTSPEPVVADCRIGKGRAILVADADMLDMRLVEETQAENRQWFQSTIDALSGRAPESPNHRIIWTVAILAAATTILGAILWRRRKKPEQRRNNRVE